MKLAYRGGDGLLTGLYETSGKLPEEPIVRWLDRSQGARRAYRRAQVDLPDVRFDEVSKDHDSIEGAPHGDIVRKRGADLPVRIMRHEIDAANVYEASRRARSLRTIPRNDEPNCRWRRQGVIASFGGGRQHGADLNREGEVTLVFSV